MDKADILQPVDQWARLISFSLWTNGQLQAISIALASIAMNYVWQPQEDKCRGGFYLAHNRCPQSTSQQASLRKLGKTTAAQVARL